MRKNCHFTAHEKGDIKYFSLMPPSKLSRPWDFASFFYFFWNLILNFIL